MSALVSRPGFRLQAIVPSVVARVPFGILVNMGALGNNFTLTGGLNFSIILDVFSFFFAPQAIAQYGLALWITCGQAGRDGACPGNGGADLHNTLYSLHLCAARMGRLAQLG